MGIGIISVTEYLFFAFPEQQLEEPFWLSLFIIQWSKGYIHYVSFFQRAEVGVYSRSAANSDICYHLSLIIKIERFIEQEIRIIFLEYTGPSGFLKFCLFLANSAS